MSGTHSRTVQRPYSVLRLCVCWLESRGGHGIVKFVSLVLWTASQLDDLDFCRALTNTYGLALKMCPPQAN
jgi:hypothetical protein